MGQVVVGEGEQKNVKRDTFWSIDITGDLNQRGYEGLDFGLEVCTKTCTRKFNKEYILDRGILENLECNRRSY
jgi:hypothetical protein